jgi:acyl dehydratase
MTLDASLVGHSIATTTPFDVTAQRVDAFAASAGSPTQDRAAGSAAPATFPIVVVFPLLEQLLADADVPLHRIVHGDQRFTYERPVAVGDRLSAVLTVRSVRSVAGNDLVGLRAEVSDERGRTVCTSGTTLVHRAEAS